MGAPPRAPSGLDAEHVHFDHGDGRGAPHLGVGFPHGILGGRLWLGRFLVAVRPHWLMRDQFHSDSSDSASEEA